ncbi:MAG: OstA-like protein [Bacteroidia bacterium]
MWATGLRGISVLLVQIGIASWTWAQKVHVENADEVGGTPERRVLRGNVVFRQDTLLLHCQEAVITSDGSFTASGGVQTFFGGSGKISAASLRYDPSLRRLTYEGEVQGDFPPSRLRASRLHYDRNSEVAWYDQGGILQDTTGEIHSQYGSYDTRTDIATFSGRVRVYKGTAQAIADTLIYDSRHYYATFPVPVTIYDTQRKDTLVASQMEWNRLTGETFAKVRTIYRDTAHIISAMEGYFAPDQDSAAAFCDIHFKERRGRIYAWADTAIWVKDSLHLHTNASVLLSDPETTFVQAEHLWTQGYILHAAGQVELFYLTLKARSDTLKYDTLNHITELHGHAWLADSAAQVYADKIFLYFNEKKKIDSAYASGSVHFVSMADSFLGFFHQIVSDFAYAKWDTTGILREISFLGRVQAVYYQSENKEWRGVHYLRAGKLYIRLDSLQQPYYIRSEEKPQGVVFPTRRALEAPIWIKGVYWIPEDKQPKVPFCEKPVSK